jgi:hypothetical protein
MITLSLLSSFVAFVALVTVVHGQQQVFNNATTLTGTWSSGSMNVVTGPGFANPLNQSFMYPKTTGISYSFTDDGHYEIARYRFSSNGSQPNCVVGVLTWCHGTYTLLSNGSIVVVPFADGFQVVQDPCGADSILKQGYNLTELYLSWMIVLDPNTNQFVFYLFQFDGSALAPQFLVSTTPNMLPTQQMTNYSLLSSTIINAGDARIRWDPRVIIGAILGMFVAQLAGLAL